MKNHAVFFLAIALEVSERQAEDGIPFEIRQIEMNIDSDKLENLISKNQKKFSSLEDEYGILDFSGDAESCGFTSDEITPEFIDDAWEAMLGIMKPWVLPGAETMNGVSFETTLHTN